MPRQLEEDVRSSRTLKTGISSVWWPLTRAVVVTRSSGQINSVCYAVCFLAVRRCLILRSGPLEAAKLIFALYALLLHANYHGKISWCWPVKQNEPDKKASISLLCCVRQLKPWRGSKLFSLASKAHRAVDSRRSAAPTFTSCSKQRPFRSLTITLCPVPAQHPPTYE